MENILWTDKIVEKGIRLVVLAHLLARVGDHTYMRYITIDVQTVWAY